ALASRRSAYDSGNLRLDARHGVPRVPRLSAGARRDAIAAVRIMFRVARGAVATMLAMAAAMTACGDGDTPSAPDATSGTSDARVPDATPGASDARVPDATPGADAALPDAAAPDVDAATPPRHR